MDPDAWRDVNDNDLQLLLPLIWKITVISFPTRRIFKTSGKRP